MNGPDEFTTRIVDLARGWIGTPYLHQASCRGIGCDCLGLVRGVWRDGVVAALPDGIAMCQESGVEGH